MPHFKCAACRTRLHSTSALADLVEELCPECGVVMKPAAGTAELVGFRLITPLEIQRWVDDGGLMAEAVAMPWPERS